MNHARELVRPLILLQKRVQNENKNNCVIVHLMARKELLVNPLTPSIFSEAFSKRFVGQYNAYSYEITYFYRFDGESFEEIASSECNHKWTTGLANYRGSALTVGSVYGHSNCRVKTEIYDFGTNKWIVSADYPFNSK